MISPAARMQHLSQHFFAVLSVRLAAMQAQGLDVVRLDEGSPDLPPPAHIIQALTEAASCPHQHAYQPHRGPQALRQAWAEMYRRLYQIELDPQAEVLPLLGSKEGIFHLLQAYIEPGDVVLAPDPGYVTYTRGALFAGGHIYPMPLLPESGYLPDFEAIPPQALARAKMLWLNYPNNPTGATASLDFFARAVAFARQHNLLLCHDAAYAQVTFDGYCAPSLLQIPEARQVGVEFNSLSKSHNMAGWRVGALLGSPQVIQTLFTLKTNADSSHFLPVLQAAAAAMTGEQGWITHRNEIYRQRRDVIVSALNRMGLPVTAP
ncbi:MAG: aminotransferase class I/II-fold pyridoxal phosphate-dependent enzyme, partial [Anaerolineales bacterium]|nr:aminotransferase class I/II-fold pyridoxal phosphate-dependent enzyme [Anaerolineales bacterium]